MGKSNSIKFFPKKKSFILCEVINLINVEKLVCDLSSSWLVVLKIFVGNFLKWENYIG